MIPREDALQRVLLHAWTLESTSTPLRTAVGRVLTEKVCSDVDQPPFNKSSMDGYACRRADIHAPLRVLEHVPAGKVPQHPLSPGTCTKVMTGAPVPKGTDCVLMVEHVEELDDGTVRFTRDETKANICPQGEDVRVGDTLLESGTCLRIAHLPVLASAGVTEVPVARQPRVAILATGDELVSPDLTPPPGKIRNTNSAQLVALVEAAGGVATELGSVSDEHASLTAAWESALAEHDVVISTGGVSMGDYDLVPDILAHHGFEVHFDRVAIQPGKPVLFGTRDRQACFGLSGNPVSSYLQFTLFAAPFLWRLQGVIFEPPVIHLALGTDFTRRNGGREGWVPVRLDGGRAVLPIEFHGSAHIHALTHADGWIAFPKDEVSMVAGRVVAVQLLSM